jgi:hypothetical protein
MILEKPVVDQLVGTKDYECELLKRRVSHRILQDQMNLLGNIFCFETSLKLGAVRCENALIFAAELPNVDCFGSICFQRLYAAELGSLLTHFTSEDHYTDGTTIFSTKSQIGIMLSNVVKNTALFHVIFPLAFDSEVVSQHGDKFKCLDLDEEKLASFKVTSCEIFNNTLRNIHLDSNCDYI